MTSASFPLPPASAVLLSLNSYPAMILRTLNFHVEHASICGVPRRRPPARPRPSSAANGDRSTQMMDKLVVGTVALDHSYSLPVQDGGSGALRDWKTYAKAARVYAIPRPLCLIRPGLAAAGFLGMR